MKYEIAIIGGGPGGYVAAIRASQMGAKVALIEEESLGGTCLNRGCIPTKKLLSISSLVPKMKSAAKYGIHIGDYSINYEKFIDSKDQLVTNINQSIAYLLQKNKVDLFMGNGRIVTPHRVAITNITNDVNEIEADKIILATGSVPQTLPVLKNSANIVTSTEALNWRTLPDSILIVGGGAVGCELAVLFNNLGVKVTLEEMQPTILNGVDWELASYFHDLLTMRGINVVTGTQIVSVDENDRLVNVALASGETLAAEKVIVSVGRHFNTEGLGLEDVGVELGPQGEIPVNDYLQTKIDGIFAVGDVTNKILLAHVASAQGIAAAQTIMGQPTRVNYDVVPHCIYTFPEIACVGLTEAKARKRGLSIKVGKFPFQNNGKALADSNTEGMVKLIADTCTDQILGVHIIGCHATELIAEGALAISHGISGKQLAAAIHAHPTLSEGMVEAANALYGMGIHC